MSLSPDSTFFLQLIIFVAVWLVLSACLFKPVIAVLDRRRQRLEGDLEEAEALDRQSQAWLEECESRVREAKLEGAALRDRRRQQALKEEQALLSRARQEADAFLDNARAELDAEAQKARREIFPHIEAFSREIADRALRN